MTIQSQLDQVLARCPFCGGEPNRYEYEDHGARFMVYNVLCGNDNCHADECRTSSTNNQAEADAAWNKRAALGGVGETIAWWREDHVCHAHELTAENALADGYKPCVIKCEDCAWNASLCDTHGAVGGEAAGEIVGYIRELGCKEPTSQALVQMNRVMPDGTKLYASPPATVDVWAIVALCEKFDGWVRELAEDPDASNAIEGQAIQACRAELAALIGKEA